MDSTKKIATQKRDSKCAAIKASLFAYCADELDSATRKEVESHLKTCTNCRLDLEEYKRVIDVLLANSKQEITVPRTISPRKRKRMLWLMGHPFFAFCVAHHRLTALIVSLTTIIIILVALFTIKIALREKPVGEPVQIIVDDTVEALPELDPEQPIPLE